jgi:ABC-2 type transport system permease protein
MGAIIKRELSNYFKTPLGYIFMGLFLLVTGFFFAYGNLVRSSPDFNQFLQTVLFVYLFAIPLLTMRLLSEERNQQTDQLLFTSPVRLGSIVGAKFLAAFLMFVITLAVTALYAIVIAIHGDLAVWETVGAYIGFILLGGCFIAVGVFVSALSENQVTSAFFTFFVLLLIWLIDPVKQVAPSETVFGVIFVAIIAAAIAFFLYLNTRSWLVSGIFVVLAAAAIVITLLVDAGMYRGIIAKVLDWFSLLSRFNNFALGILKLNVVVFYASFIGVFLYLTVRILEKRRWA